MFNIISILIGCLLSLTGILTFVNFIFNYFNEDKFFRKITKEKFEKIIKNNSVKKVTKKQAQKIYLKEKRKIYYYIEKVNGKEISEYCLFNKEY